MSDTSDRTGSTARGASDLNVDPETLESQADESKDERGDDKGRKEASLQQHHDPSTNEDTTSGGSAESESDGSER